VVFTWGTEGTPESLADVTAAQERSCRGALHLVQALARLSPPPRLWLVTRGAQCVGDGQPVPGVAHAALWGLGRSLQLEHPELRPVLVDLDPAEDSGELRLLVDELHANGADGQVALRGNTRHAARLRPATGPAPGHVRLSRPEQGASFRLEVPSRGVLDELVLRPMERRAPGAGEVEIEVEAAGLNFLDVMDALGVLPFERAALGGECAGRVTAVGPGVEDLAPGDPVVAVAPASFASHVVARRALVARRPEQPGAAEAAAFPVAFLTAHYALERLAGLRAGQRVLIHAAAGGVGLAAVQLALKAGAEVFATVGSREKRERLEAMGVKHILSSRSLDFAQGVLERTGGQGVDVVLNSLAGEFIPRSLGVLRSGGTFIEIGKTGIWDEARVAVVYPGVRYVVLDLHRECHVAAEEVGTALAQLMCRLADGSLAPLPVTAFPVDEAPAAFRYMAQARHMGKVVLTLPPPAEAPLQRLRADGTYLVTGGLGALGLLVGEWMAEHGAGNLVLLGRRAPDAHAEAAVRRMEKAGARVVVRQVDVSRHAQLGDLLAELAETMPPLRGVVHSAGVLDDGALLRQRWERFRSVLGPKVDGAWSLHELTRRLPLDFFVSFSSVAALLGPPGQANHAAANAFLDALAHHRRALGLPATSINWGVWSEVGEAAERDVAARVAAQGVEALPPRLGLELFERILRDAPVQVGAFAVDWPRFLASIPATPALLADVQRAPASREVERPSPASSGLRQRVESAAPEARLDMLRDFARAEVARVLGLASGDSLEGRRGLFELGMDSLMSIELRNRVQRELGLTLPPSFAFDCPNIDAVAAYLDRALPRAAPPPEPAPPPPAEPTAKDTHENLRGEALMRLLDSELDSIEALLREVRE
jgi:NADPH:quinone reductase-like Zn-dependent oxidoreductase/acyl carrier protein